jgi:hypothetical protein
LMFYTNEIWVKGVQERLAEKGICTESIGWTKLRSRKFNDFSFSRGNPVTRDGAFETFTSLWK